MKILFTLSVSVTPNNKITEINWPAARHQPVVAQLKNRAFDSLHARLWYPPKLWTMAIGMTSHNKSLLYWRRKNCTTANYVPPYSGIPTDTDTFDRCWQIDVYGIRYSDDESVGDMPYKLRNPAQVAEDENGDELDDLDKVINYVEWLKARK